MALAILTLACLLFYARSKYFPWQDVAVVKQHKNKLVALASATALLSLYLFSLKPYDLTMAVLIWSVAFMTLLSMLVVSVKLNKQWAWAWGGLCLVFILMDVL